MTAPVCERDDNCITDVLKDVLTQIRGMIKRLKKEAITAMIQFEHTIQDGQHAHYQPRSQGPLSTRITLLVTRPFQNDHTRRSLIGQLTCPRLYNAHERTNTGKKFRPLHSVKPLGYLTCDA